MHAVIRYHPLTTKYINYTRDWGGHRLQAWLLCWCNTTWWGTVSTCYYLTNLSKLKTPSSASVGRNGHIVKSAILGSHILIAKICRLIFKWLTEFWRKCSYISMAVLFYSNLCCFVFNWFAFSVRYVCRIILMLAIPVQPQSQLQPRLVSARLYWNTVYTSKYMYYKAINDIWCNEFQNGCLQFLPVFDQIWMKRYD